MAVIKERESRSIEKIILQYLSLPEREIFQQPLTRKGLIEKGEKILMLSDGDDFIPIEKAPWKTFFDIRISFPQRGGQQTNDEFIFG